MPVVKIDMWEGRSAGEKRKLIQTVSGAVSEALGVSAEHVTVVINEVPKENWGLKGNQASEVFKG